VTLEEPQSPKTESIGVCVYSIRIECNSKRVTLTTGRKNEKKRGERKEEVCQFVRRREWRIAILPPSNRVKRFNRYSLFYTPVCCCCRNRHAPSRSFALRRVNALNKRIRLNFALLCSSLSISVLFPASNSVELALMQRRGMSGKKEKDPSVFFFVFLFFSTAFSCH
jgi:hypothetical protein